MDDDAWDLLRDERLSLARTLATLSDAQWATRTLCTEWTVRDVVAHLVMTSVGEPSLSVMAAATARARGNVWHASRDLTRTAAERRSPGELVRAVEESADSRRRPVFVVDANILPDVVVHGQDIAVPLGLHRQVPAVVAGVALARLWSMGFPFHARRRLAGVRLCCADGTSWTAGEGPEVSGSAGALALLMTQRTTAALSMLQGPGVARLEARLAHA
ncbi:maleylpyruvate isomerase family mycothiol-dependent enzyme [Nocardioides ochotonae]|uniref:maleylpyruvate isomerase family mycothiol-dependent enzyme n=1 Tax=Nocardioides ochotonae TaxID=2685869 RepID=UPI00140B9661|nr:maleylpyruvate isomerase family mycothiol-dependent enzyme [Nocardioides ochotonae]